MPESVEVEAAPAAAAGAGDFLSPRKRIPFTIVDSKAFAYHVFVSKRHKLVMFTIPKVSCTEFIRLFFRLNGDPHWASEPHFRRGKPLLKDLPLGEVENILNDPTWTKAVFFRDPSKRFRTRSLLPPPPQAFVGRSAGVGLSV